MTYSMIALIAAIAAAITFVLDINYMKKHPKTVPARVEKAKALGHVVKARLKRENYRERLHNSERYCEADYTYTVDGKEYRYDYLEPKVPPAEINLYYIDNPKKAFWDGSETIGQSTYKLVTYLLPFAVFVIVTVILNSLFM